MLFRTGVARPPLFHRPCWMDSSAMYSAKSCLESSFHDLKLHPIPHSISPSPSHRPLAPLPAPRIFCNQSLLPKPPKRDLLPLLPWQYFSVETSLELKIAQCIESHIAAHVFHGLIASPQNIHFYSLGYYGVRSHGLCCRSLRRPSTSLRRKHSWPTCGPNRQSP